ncbi:MAG: hypothetical protein CBE00_12000 [Planctomycetaceae bacterium TMED240]|nr:hypothetical protein [Rhodopirellula sp.]OUX04817.1 MAG: hypothetical protein CBE00_12000 [Planctomycetaceae bacterium TMED240]
MKINRNGYWQRPTKAIGLLGWQCVAICSLVVFGLITSKSVSASELINFNQDIRPILAAHCFHCHGPDEAESGLRLDEQDGVQDAFGEPKLADNLAWRRILSNDPDEKMPPPAPGNELDEEELALLKRWIAQGAEYQSHWSFVQPQRPELAVTSSNLNIRNPIDAFVSQKLGSKDLQLQKDATREQLIRRLSLDLIGLPPTPAEVDAFVEDGGQDAYERVVDRLLGSKHYGERLAVPWLDAARYADTNGFSIDDHRDMWLWREWVINALNQNMPYDQFLTEQLAGDLLPNATDQQRLATGFLRNSMNTHEGGTLPDEYRVIYIADKINTVATVFMGLTMRCAQCHSHKYDPITQKDYYRFFAFFDTAHEPGSGAANGNTSPVQRMDGLLTRQDEYKADVLARIATLKRYQMHPPELIQARMAWEKDLQGDAPSEIADVLVVPVAARTDDQWKRINQEFGKTTQLMDRHVSTINREIKVLEKDLEATQASVMVMKEKGPRKTYVLTRGEYDQPDTSQLVTPGVPGVLPMLELDQVDVGEEHHAEQKPDAVVAWQSARWIWDSPNASKGNQGSEPRFFRFVVELGRKPKRAELSISVDNIGVAFVNGHQLGTNEPWMTPAQYEITKHLRVGKNVIAVKAINQGGAAGLVASLVIDGKVEYGSNQNWKVTAKNSIAENSDWTFAAYDDHDWGDASELGPLGMPPWNFARLLEQAAPVDPERPTRLTLAKWLVRDDHPLTARVAVNRYWQMLFGRGLVSTPDDFGSQGAYPTHPELLDWLAIEFRDSGWNIKWLLKTIVMSSTYRQSSTASREAFNRDPLNRWLARAPRYRLSAEFLRDGMLAISGQLNRRVGGPSVYPSQPHGLWREISHFGYGNAFSAQAFYPSDPDGQSRRSMYTFWKRTSPPPSMIAFDAPTREVCAVSRSRTNTPLQALVLLNDPNYVAAAKSLAQLAMAEGGESVGQHIDYMFRRAVSRRPTSEERKVLSDRYESALAAYQEDPEAAAGLAGKQKEHVTAAVAAWTVVASVILNLDEVITRE